MFEQKDEDRAVTAASETNEGSSASATAMPAESAECAAAFPQVGASLLRLEIEEHVTAIGGHHMHSLQAGSGSPLILIHGLLGAAACWKPAMQALAHVARVYAIDALGIGASDRVAGLDAGLEASANRLRSFMDGERIAKADLCATSHGGAVAMFFAALYPERVRSLILQAPANPFCSRSQPQIRLFSSKAGKWLGRLIPDAPRRLQIVALKRMYGDPLRLRPGSLDEYVGSLRVPGTVDYVLSVLACWGDDMARLKHLLKRLRGLPCLLLWGTHDRAVSLASGEVLQRVLGAELDLFPGVGHLPYEEEPQAFASRVSDFLSLLPAASPAMSS